MQLFEFFILTCVAFTIFFFSYWLSTLFFELVSSHIKVVKTQLLFRNEILRNNHSGRILSNLVISEPKFNGNYTMTFIFINKLHSIVKFMFLNLSIVMYPEIKKINYFQILKFRRREFYFWSSVLQK